MKSRFDRRRTIVEYQNVTFILLLLVLHSEHLSPAMGRNISLSNVPSLSAVINSSLTLPCQTENQVIGQKFLWMRNGFGFGPLTVSDVGEGRYSFPGPIEDGVYNLHIENLQLDDDAMYSCQISQPAEKPTTAATANLTVLVPTAKPILSQLISYATNRFNERHLINEGAEVSEVKGHLRLRCEARDGRPASILRWLVDGRPISRELERSTFLRVVSYPPDQILISSKHQKLFTVRSELELSGFTRSFHKVEIACESTNLGLKQAMMTQRTSTHLSVLFGPVVYVTANPNPANKNYTEGDVVIFTCHAEGRPNEFIYSWSKVKLDTDVKIRFDNAIEPTFRLKMTRDLNLLAIQCGVTSRDSASNFFGPLNIFYRPQISQAQRLYPASVEESEIKLRCDADANPSARFEWRRKDNPEILSRTNTLVLNFIKSSDFGEYECVARSHNFSPAIESVWLSRKTAPRIKSPQVQYGEIGQSTKILCDIDSIPEPKPEQLAWIHMGSRLDIDDQGRYHIYTHKVFGGVKYTLFIREVRTSDYGLYNCSVNNGYGYANAGITLAAKAAQIATKESSSTLGFLVYKIPIAFVAGAAVAIVMISVFLTFILCVCRRGACGRRYFKASTSEQHAKTFLESLPYTAEGSTAKHDIDSASCSRPDDQCWMNRLEISPRSKCCYHYGNELDDNHSQVSSLSRHTCQLHHHRQTSRCSNSYSSHQEHLLVNTNSTCLPSYRGLDTLSGGGGTPTSTLSNRSFAISALACNNSANFMPQVPERGEQFPLDDRSCDSGYGGLLHHYHLHKKQHGLPSAPVPELTSMAPKSFSVRQGFLLPLPQQGVVSFKGTDQDRSICVTD